MPGYFQNVPAGYGNFWLILLWQHYFFLKNSFLVKRENANRFINITNRKLPSNRKVKRSKWFA